MESFEESKGMNDDTLFQENQSLKTKVKAFEEYQAQSEIFKKEKLEESKKYAEIESEN